MLAFNFTFRMLKDFLFMFSNEIANSDDTWTFFNLIWILKDKNLILPSIWKKIPIILLNSIFNDLQDKNYYDFQIERICSDKNIGGILLFIVVWW